jgi:ABC-type multidrug transport system permease subunit
MRRAALKHGVNKNIMADYWGKLFDGFSTRKLAVTKKREVTMHWTITSIQARTVFIPAALVFMPIWSALAVNVRVSYIPIRRVLLAY